MGWLLVVSAIFLVFQLVGVLIAFVCESDEDPHFKGDKLQYRS
jgi:hypothetical protein